MPDQQEIFNRVANVIVETLKVDRDRITPASRLVEDLNADSLDRLTLLMQLEEEFERKITDEDAQGSLPSRRCSTTSGAGRIAVSRRVVVTGIGVVTPLAVGVAEFWRRALAGESVCEPLPAHWAAYYRPHSSVWAPLPSRDFAAQGISRVEAAQLDRSEQIAVVCAREALEAAGIAVRVKDAKKGTCTLEGIDPLDAGVFLGTGIGGATSLIANVANHVGTSLLGSFPAEAAALGATSGAGALQPLRRVDGDAEWPRRRRRHPLRALRPQHDLRAACASGTVAIGHALRAVRSGEMRLALAGGVEYLADEYGGLFAPSTRFGRSPAARATRAERTAPSTRGAAASSSPRAAGRSS